MEHFVRFQLSFYALSKYANGIVNFTRFAICFGRKMIFAYFVRPRAAIRTHKMFVLHEKGPKSFGFLRFAYFAEIESRSSFSVSIADCEGKKTKICLEAAVSTNTLTDDKR